MAVTPIVARLHAHRRITLGAGLFILLGYGVYTQAAPDILANVAIGSVSVGGLSKQQALEKIAPLYPAEGSISAIVEGKEYLIPYADLNLKYDTVAAVNHAWKVGRSGHIGKRAVEVATLPLASRTIPVPTTLDQNLLKQEIATIKQAVDEPGKDIRLKVTRQAVTILTDTKIGFVLDEGAATAAVLDAIARREAKTQPLTLTVTKPTVAYDTALIARGHAERAIAQPLKLLFDQRTFVIDPDRLTGWTGSQAAGEQLTVHFDERLISEYVVTLATELNAEPQSAKVNVSNGKVIEFQVPRTGRRLDQDRTVAMIIEELTKRMQENAQLADLTLPVSVEKPVAVDQSAAELGIVELIGSASTRFTGSPKNRIANIKNGVKFLTGVLVKPGEEFSTLKTLGKIDNTTGYLPELVIKLNRTVPEFGGGLCQVSTTLFRAALNSGLPITARQNHSYRVSYYEKDGDGHQIGPGLDATIYNPAPDFKFSNDTGATILIQGYVEGDKITFDFYGTRDGRTSVVDGPKTLSQTAAGEPIYVETDTLKPGEVKQIERPHPGGTAIATYTVTYPDGTVKEQVFKSFYRNWPAQYLVGADPSKATTTPAAPLGA